MKNIQIFVDYLLFFMGICVVIDLFSRSADILGWLIAILFASFNVWFNRDRASKHDE